MKLLAVDQTGQKFPIDIDLSKSLGEGATASVYRVVFKNELLAAKIYKPDRTFSTEKLEAMLGTPPADLNTKEESRTFIQYTWVEYLLKDSTEKTVGFLMPFVDQRATNSLDTYYDPVLIKRLSGSTPSALSLRLEIAHNLCNLISKLHAIGHHFIDIKPQNIRVYKDNNKVVLMDCDGYSIKNHYGTPDRFPADLISTDFIAPEVFRNHLSPTSLGEEQDRYGLAVILFQLLNFGTHPFQGIVTDPSIQASTNDERAALGLYPHGLLPHPGVKPRTQSIHDLLLTETRALFDRAFTSLTRPSAQEWAEHFHEILEKRLLVRCKKYPSDVRHIHFKDQGCIGCKTEEEKKKSKQGVQQTRQYHVPQNDASDPNGAGTGSQGVTPSQTLPYTPPSSKSSGIDGGVWAFIGAVVFVAVLYLANSTDKNSREARPSQSPTPQSTSSADPNCPQLEIKQLSVADACRYYWSNLYPNCKPSIESELLTRDRLISPEGSCGQLNTSKANPPAAPTQAPPSLSTSEKIEYLHSASSTSRITKESISHNSTATKYWFEVLDELTSNLNKATRTTSDGLEVFSGVSIHPIKGFTLSGHNGESCSSQSVGRVGSCIVSGSIAKCQIVEDQNYKRLCIESITK